MTVIGASLMLVGMGVMPLVVQLTVNGAQTEKDPPVGEVTVTLAVAGCVN